MNLNTVNEFRHAIYACFTRAADALFNTVDALATETSAPRRVDWLDCRTRTSGRDRGRCRR